jgi:hypothetical protein
MDIPPFLLDHWLSKHSFATPPIAYDLAASTGPKWTVGELLALGEGASLDDTILSYSPAEGSRALRGAIGAFLGVDPDWVVATTGASEAIRSCCARRRGRARTSCCRIQAIRLSSRWPAYGEWTSGMSGCRASMGSASAPTTC